MDIKTRSLPRVGANTVLAPKTEISQSAHSSISSLALAVVKAEEITTPTAKMGKKKNRNRNKKRAAGSGAAAANNTAATGETPAAATASTAPGSSLPEGVESSLFLFTKQQQILVKLLCSPILKQQQLFASWSDPNTTDECKKQLVTQLTDLNSSYPGGLPGYITNARKLLEQSKQGVNPLEGWKPNVPTGQAFEIGTSEYDTVEALGVKELGSVGFVLVAGGLGERLGYTDIKVRCRKLF